MILHGAFFEGQDYTALGMEYEWDYVDWEPLYVKPEDISLAYRTNQGHTNLIIKGEKWTVKEQFEDIIKSLEG